MDVVSNIISEGKYDDNYPVEEGREHLIKGDGFKKRDVVVDINPEDVYMDNVMDGNNVVKKQLYEKPERRDVMIDIIDTGMVNTEYEADIINAVMHDEDVINVIDENNAAPPTEELQLYYYQFSTSKGRC
jgi:hypothetical protein